MTDGYQGDPAEFPFCLGLNLMGTYRLPGLAGECAHCHFMGTDNEELSAFVFAIYRNGGTIEIAFGVMEPLDCLELSTQ